MISELKLLCINVYASLMGETIVPILLSVVGLIMLFSTKNVTLWVEEACYPKCFGSSFKHPVVELFVSFQKLCEPKAQCG